MYPYYNKQLLYMNPNGDRVYADVHTKGCSCQMCFEQKMKGYLDNAPTKFETVSFKTWPAADTRGLVDK